MENLHNPEGIKKLSLSLRSLDTDWQDAGQIVISSTGTTPTKGTVVRDKLLWRRHGDSMEIRVEYEQNASGTAGTGEYLVQIPSGFQIDANKVRFSATVSGGFNQYSCVGNGTITNLSSIGQCSIEVYDASHVRVGIVWDDNVTAKRGVWGNDFYLSIPTIRVALHFSVPIIGWSIKDSYINPTNTLATKQDMENLTPGKTVSPNVLGFHPGVAKVWANFTPSGGNIIINDSFNVSSIVYNSAGTYTINFTQPFASNNYVVAMTSTDDNFRVPDCYLPGTKNTAMGPNYCKVRIADYYVGWTARDHSVFTFIAFGK